MILQTDGSSLSCDRTVKTSIFISISIFLYKLIANVGLKTEFPIVQTPSAEDDRKPQNRN